MAFEYGRLSQGPQGVMWWVFGSGVQKIEHPDPGRLTLDLAIAALGRDGWELVTIDDFTERSWIFKRTV